MQNLERNYLHFCNMKKPFNLSIPFASIFVFLLSFNLCSYAQDKSNEDTTVVEIKLAGNHSMYFDFYGDNIFRWYYDPAGKPMHAPASRPPAQILVDNPRKPVATLLKQENNNEVLITTNRLRIKYVKQSQVLQINDLASGKTIVQTMAPVAFDKDKTSLLIKANSDEYFYGGGVQNGRFSHKGNKIAIENQNSWTDGGVASPTPFYWSTNGYGLMWYTFKKGLYDFGSKDKDIVNLSHETSYLDVFFMVDATPAAILNDFYQLTGHPVLLPKFAFYEGHLNAYNRDYWKEDPKGILFEDGKRYVESQKDNGGIKESLNGEKDNYQFSARAVIDRYQKHDMPMGWILPNDGYGAGYGQTSTLDSNILNLKLFGDYARQHGVQIGLWTQSDLHPKAGVSALLQRDLEKEVGVAGVRVLKTDVAWVGPGYSFGLNGIADAANIMIQHGNDARPFIISLDGWAGTQRYASVWTGDQTGGEWEYIRFHIPTYIGSGLSGQPNITSDMDGIFGGKNPVINIRDFQWKTFSLMQLNMDGWGLNPKYPFALGEPATSINRNYLKLKSALLPYTYSVAHRATNGLPVIRAMFLEEPNAFTLGKATEYQYMYGPDFLVAPVYKNTNADDMGNDVRNGIYLPKGKWIDYFSGEEYEGGRVINNVAAPVWKLPVFVKAGAIIPMTEPNNHPNAIDQSVRIYEVYPAGKSSFTEYDDDGVTEKYMKGESVTTQIESSVTGDVAAITVHKAIGNYDGFVKDKATIFRINVTENPKSVEAKVNGKSVRLKKAKTVSEFDQSKNVFYYEADLNLNNYSTPGSESEKLKVLKNPQVFVKIAPHDITKSEITVTVKGFRFAPADALLYSTGALQSPVFAGVPDTLRKAFALTPSWSKVRGADYYEIEFDGMLYSTIRDTFLLFENLNAETDYAFIVRAVNKSGASEWKSFAAKTQPNPLQFAIKGIRGYSSAPDQEGEEINQLFDFDESNMWHTSWKNNNAVPFDITMDLGSFNTIDKIVYVPRDRGNGVILQGDVYYAKDTTDWKKAGSFDWKYNGEKHEFKFPENKDVSWIKIHVTKAVRDYGSGKELYVFKVPGTESLLRGDINHDGKVDQNDLTSYMNYAGLRKGDADFEGYVSKGDINDNGMIDAYDISYTASHIGDAEVRKPETVAGKIELVPNKNSYRKGETVEIAVNGVAMESVHALSFALPYSQGDLVYKGITPSAVGQMENFSNDRLHTNGSKELFAAFVNVGDKPVLNGNQKLFVIRFVAQKNLKLELTPENILLVSPGLNYRSF